MASLYNRNSSNIWWVRFQLNGKRVQRSTGTSKKAQALRLLARLMEEERQRQEQGFTEGPVLGFCAMNIAASTSRS